MPATPSLRPRSSLDRSSVSAGERVITGPDWRSLLPVCLGATSTTGDRNAGDLLLQFTMSARSLREGFMRIFGPRGFSDHKFIVLVVLGASESRSSTPSELADYAGITRASMTDVLDSLARRRWIVRGRDPKNRRNVRVTLTAQGRRAVEAAAADYFALSADLLRSLSPSDVAGFARVCAFLQDAGAALVPRRPSMPS